MTIVHQSWASGIWSGGLWSGRYRMCLTVPIASFTNPLSVQRLARSISLTPSQTSNFGRRFFALSATAATASGAPGTCRWWSSLGCWVCTALILAIGLPRLRRTWLCCRVTCLLLWCTFSSAGFALCDDSLS